MNSEKLTPEFGDSAKLENCKN